MPSEPRAGETEKELEKRKATYVGAPACFALDLALRPVVKAFDNVGCYLVGSATQRRDWRDVDVRLMMTDEAFAKEFPDSWPNHWEGDVRWLLLTTAISRHLSHVTGLPIDFQIQPMTPTNERHKGTRFAIGLEWAKKSEHPNG